MGKLLHRLLHRMLPTWITKLKVASALGDASPKKLPFFRGPIFFSIKPWAGSSAPSSAATTTTTTNTDGDASEHESKESSEEQQGSWMRKRKSEWVEEDERKRRRRSSRSWRWRKKERARKAENEEEEEEEEGEVHVELPECLCDVVGNSSALVKVAHDPHQELWVSMVEMIVGNGLWDLGTLECLLYCYLGLNDPHLHHLIHLTFLRVLHDLERIP